MSDTAYIGIGSNLEPQKNVRQAMRELRRVGQVIAISTVWMTEPIGRPEQPAFYNLVAELRTDLPPEELRSALRQIEDQLGRRRTADRYAARTIDLDILIYGDRVVDSDISERAFLAMGIWEMDPELRLPGSGQPIADIAGRFREHTMKRLDDYTQELRAEIQGA